MESHLKLADFLFRESCVHNNWFFRILEEDACFLTNYDLYARISSNLEIGE